MAEIDIAVQSLLPPDEPQGCIRLQIDPTQTVESLMKKLCFKANVPLRPTYFLRNSRSKILERSQTLQNCGVENGNVLNWTDEGVRFDMRRCACNTWWILCVISLFIGAAGIVTISILKIREPTVAYDFGIVFDAGSSHTSMYIYRWDGAKLNTTAVAVQYGNSCRVPGKGISSYAANPQAIVPGLKQCLDTAKARIAKNKQKNTPVYLGATAGMRLLREVNQTASDAVLAVVRETIDSYKFNFSDPVKQARIISGDEEGTFSWITSNYMAGLFNTPDVKSSLQSSASLQYGAMDLGGASTQMTFIPALETEMPDSYQYRLQLYGFNYTLYTHSYLCYGVNEMIRRFKAALVVTQQNETVTNPCGQKGLTINDTLDNIFRAPCVSGEHAELTYGSRLLLDFNLIADSNVSLVGTGDPNTCRQLVEQYLFNFSVPCNFSQCSFNGQFQPPVDGEFYAFSSFFYVTNFLNLTDGKSQFSMTDFNNSITSFCLKPWKEVKVMPATSPTSKQTYCLQATYIYSLLTHGYKFNASNWKNIHFMENIRGTDIGWSLGFMLTQSNNLPVDFPQVAMAIVTFVLLMVLFGIFILISIAFAFHARRHQQDGERGIFHGTSSYGTI